MSTSLHIATFDSPAVLAFNAWTPTATLFIPILLSLSALVPIATLNAPFVLDASARSPNTTFAFPPAHRPKVIPRIRASHHVRVMMTPLAVADEPIRSFSVLFDLNTRSCALVLQRKSLAQIVFPESAQYVPEREVVVDCQLARPTASEISIFHAHGVPPVIFIVPATSSFAHGDDVPIPTFAPVL